MRLVALVALLLFLFVVAVLQPVFSAVVTYNWEITYVTANPDGLFERRVIGVNNAYPPPPIEVVYNDTLVVNVRNSLEAATSLHAHGLFQNGTVFMDGPVMVTQCGIPPGESFTYTIPIQQHGTYWIHAHSAGQYVDGLRAPLIIHAPTEPYIYDQEYIVTLADWYHDEHKVNNANYLSPSNPTGAEPVPQSGLINNNPSNSTLSFVPGKVYRIRVINMSAFSMFYFSIDGHDMDIIEIDGVDVNRTTVTSFPVTTAQRYSVLVRARSDASQNFAIHANMETSMFDKVPSNLNPNLTATVIYSPTAPLFAPNTSLASSDFDDTKLVPLVATASASPDISLSLNVTFEVLSDGVNRAMFNGISYLAPKVPTLFSVLSMGTDAVNPLVYGNVNPMVIGHMSMVELVINNFDVGAHPFHLHGHQFQILGRSLSDAGPYNPASPFPEQSNPSRRDTLQVPANGHAVIRFRADNPGVWLFHCHIEWHFEAGLIATIISSAPETQSHLTVPSTIVNQCTSQGILTTGNAAGLQGLDLSGLPERPGPVTVGFTTKGAVAFAATIVSAVAGLSTVVWYAWEG